MTERNTALRRVAAGIGAFALVAAGVVGGSTAASADPGPGQNGAPDRGSLTIHKYVGDEGVAGDGTEQTVSGDPLEGVEFTLWRLGTEQGGSCVPLDLATYDGWEDVPTDGAPRTAEGVEADGFCLTDGGTADTTDANGELTFAGLDLGLYYVQETDAPTEVVSRTAPFYVSIPLPHEDESWIYNVHAYPKNQVADAPEKTINTDAEQPGNGVTVGSVVEWTITQTVPTLNAGDSYESASIWDVLPDSLAYDATQSVALNGTPLVEDTDYEIDANGVTWTLLPAGLAQLTAGDEIAVTFTTTVLEVTSTGDIDNPGSNGDEPGYGSEFNGGTTPGGPTPHTYWGQLSILKVDDSTPALTLSGAEFKVFDNAAADGICPALPASGEVATGTSDDDGVVQWENVTPTNPLGLWIANSEDGPLPNPAKTYCVYETVVPAGHSASADGRSVEITPGTTNVLNETFVNPKKDGPDLPLTGAQGTLLMTVAGLLLVGIGAAAVMASRRKREHMN